MESENVAQMEIEQLEEELLLEASISGHVDGNPAPGSRHSTRQASIPELDPLVLKKTPTVKVFVIERNDGAWLDCGAGRVQFVISPKCTNLDNLQPSDIAVSVKNVCEENQVRDFLEPEREEVMRGNNSDKNVILEANLMHAKELTICQCRISLTKPQSSPGNKKI